MVSGTGVSMKELCDKESLSEMCHVGSDVVLPVLNYAPYSLPDTCIVYYHVVGHDVPHSDAVQQAEPCLAKSDHPCSRLMTSPYWRLPS